MKEDLPDTRQPGKVLLISSGETSAGAHEIYQHVFEILPPPVRVAVLETPAGFELNSSLVARKVADFLSISLRNFSPEISVVPARRRDGTFSTNRKELLAPLLEANFIYLGAGSPSYAVDHLRDSLALAYLLGRHQAGAAICLASAAAIAAGSKALPVYEIYKAGQDPHWIDGLDLFAPFGLDLAIVTHWDNREGGANLDTSRCFMGRTRMGQLLRMLPARTRVLGIDEHTGVLFDFQAGHCRVLGKGRLHILERGGSAESYPSGDTVPISRLGTYHRPGVIPPAVPALEPGRENGGREAPPSPEVLDLVSRREELRQARSWAEADALRQRISGLGYEVQDTGHGPRLNRRGASRAGTGLPADR